MVQIILKIGIITLLIGAIFFNSIARQGELRTLYALVETKKAQLEHLSLSSHDFDGELLRLNLLIESPFSLLLFFPFDQMESDLVQIDTIITQKLTTYLDTQKSVIAEQNARGIITPPVMKGKVIIVDISSQRLYAFRDGISLFTEPIPVTTGKKMYETVQGKYAVLDRNSPYEMTSPFTTEQYNNTVTYWLPFFEDYGMHDASWRSSYGELNYLEEGTHGCINVPFEPMEQLFSWAEKGTLVIVN